jgi:hypothetical protein
MKCLPIKGYEGLYSVSEDGKIFSLDREIICKNGVVKPIKGREIIQGKHKDVRYNQVSLWKANKGLNLWVHRIVAQTFIPNPENKPEVNHINGKDIYDNSVRNLEWVTSSENSIHAVQTGLITYTNRLSRLEFIEVLNDVINGESYLSITNRVPYKVPFLSTKVRQIAKEEGLEHLLDESLKEQRLIRSAINGTSFLGKT